MDITDKYKHHPSVVALFDNTVGYFAYGEGTNHTAKNGVTGGIQRKLLEMTSRKFDCEKDFISMLNNSSFILYKIELRENGELLVRGDTVNDIIELPDHILINNKLDELDL